MVRIEKRLNHYSYYAGRPYGINGLTLHSTEGNFPYDLEWLLNPRSMVSCHYLVAPSGEISQMIEDHNRAWHAGHTWGNNETIGIEISHRQGQVYPAVQMDAVTELSRSLVERYGIKPGNVVTHRFLTPRRKIDPTDWSDVDFAAWVKSLYGVDPSAPVPTSGKTRYYVVPRGIAHVRTSPDVADPDNTVMKLQQYHPVVVDEVAKGQWIGDQETGSDRWMHWETGLGFIHESGLIRED